MFTLQTLPDCRPDNPFVDTLGKVAGFSLHAGVATRANEREKLERLCWSSPGPPYPLSGLSRLTKEIDASRSVIFARMAVHHESAMEDLSVRFGAQPEEMPLLLQSIRDSGAEPALAFNVGSSVTDPEAYRYAISVARSVLEKLPFRLRLIDVGGGYPKSYPGFIVPELKQYFRAVTEL